MYYLKDGFSASELACAITEALLHDTRVNDLGLPGLPQITVTRHDSDDFLIRLLFDNLAEESFVVTGVEA